MSMKGIISALSVWCEGSWNFIAQLCPFALCGKEFAVWSYVLHVCHNYILKMFFTVRLKTEKGMKITFDADIFKPTVKTMIR